MTSILCIGDFGTGDKGQYLVADLLKFLVKKHNCKFILGLGDNINIEEKIINMCNGEQEVARAYEELKAFHDRDMYDLLRYMFYLVDFMRENKIVWGVGRGSSTASFVLYLIGIHKINPIQFQLDWREFLR